MIGLTILIIPGAGIILGVYLIYKGLTKKDEESIHNNVPDEDGRSDNEVPPS